MILVIDDQKMVLRFIEKTLENFDSEIICLNSAKAATDMAANRVPDLIICDILMPEMNGFEFRKWYEESFPYRRTPFIFHSALGSVQDEVKGLNLGADDYIAKPTDPDLLQARVRAILRMRRRYLSTCFEGLVSEYGPLQILRFCKQSGLSGAVFFHLGDDELIWTFKNGELLTAKEISDDKLAKRCERFMNGQFQILATPPTFDDLQKGMEPPASANRIKQPAKGLPPGIISGFQLGSKHFDIQTEMKSDPELEIISTVFANGQLLKKLNKKVEADPGSSELNEIVRKFHDEVASKIRGLVKEKMAQG